MTFIQFLILPFIVFVDNNPTILILTCVNGHYLNFYKQFVYLRGKFQFFRTNTARSRLLVYNNI